MLRKITNAIELQMIGAVQKFRRSERGDTNFISILIVLGIVILLATLFIGFKDKIVGMVQGIVDGFSIEGSGGGGGATP